MELRPGYKQTEVGVIPEEWEVMPLGHFSAFITKGATPTTYGFRWQDEGVLFLRSECVSEIGLDLAQSMYISHEAHSILKRGEVRSGDILITITGNVGRVVLLDDHFGFANINQHIARIRVNDIKAPVSEYVFYFLAQPQVRHYYASITTGQAYPQLSLKQVRGTNVGLPPTKSEQEAIATALSDVDALIASLDKIIAKKRDIKQAAMQQLLTGKKRLAGSSGRWEVKRLGQITEIHSGGTPSTNQSKFWDGDVLWCTPTDITALKGYKYLTHTNRTITSQGLKSSSAEMLPANSDDVAGNDW